MGIHPSTLYEWKKKYPEINEALKKGKEVVDIQVENALLKRAMGYTYEEVTKERTPIRYEDGKPVEWEMQVTKKVLKEVLPDVTAQIFWLKNRKPVEWRDKQEIDIAGKDGKPFEVNIKVVD